MDVGKSIQVSKNARAVVVVGAVQVLVGERAEEPLLVDCALVCARHLMGSEETYVSVCKLFYMVQACACLEFGVCSHLAPDAGMQCVVQEATHVTRHVFGFWDVCAHQSPAIEPLHTTPTTPWCDCFPYCVLCCAGWAVVAGTLI